MRLSVVVATLDRAHLLPDTLAALDAQVVPGPLAWEVVVVDNGSRDRTQEVVAAWAARAAIPARVVVEANVGLSNARNRGIAASRGEIIAFTDDDVLPAPDWVAGISGGMDAWDADVIGGRILPRWEAPPPAWLLADRRLLALLSILDDEVAGPVHPPPGNRHRVWGANMAFRRTAFDAVGGFDPAFGMRGGRLYRGEETDLIRRMQAAGLQVAYDPALVVSHRIGRNRSSRRYFRRLAYFEGELRGFRLENPPRRPFLGAPRRLYGIPLRIGSWLRLRARRDPHAFDAELAWWSELGELVAYWRMALHRPRHAASPSSAVGE